MHVLMYIDRMTKGYSLETFGRTLAGRETNATVAILTFTANRGGQNRKDPHN